MMYLDANASSRLRPEAEAAIIAYLNSQTGNPSSVHRGGRRARAELRKARRRCMSALGLDQDTASFVFTSGGTESCNAMISAFLGDKRVSDVSARHVLCASIEHAAVLEPVKKLVRNGWTATFCNPEPNGIISSERFVESLRKETELVILMAANNETGAIQPVAETASQLRATGYRGAIVSDVIQAIGKCAISIGELFDAGVDAVALSGHKLGGPAGIGALIFAKNSEQCRLIEPFLLGGPQEERLRGGTENLIGAIGFAEALQAAMEDSANSILKRRRLTALLWRLISEKISDARLVSPHPNGEGGATYCVCNTLAVLFPECRGDDLVVALDLEGLSASTGAACSSGKQESSHVFTAMGFTDEQAKSIVRFSLDWDAEELLVRRATQTICDCVEKMRQVLGSGRSAG